MTTDDLRGVPAAEFIAAEYGITPDQVRRTTDDLRTRAREAAEEWCPGDDWGAAANRGAFVHGFLAHAAQQPTREQIAEVLDEANDRYASDPANPDPWHAQLADAVRALLDGAGS